MAKSRNNLLGVGGQRKKLSRGDRGQSSAPPRAAGSTADGGDAKQELLRKMRERTRAPEQNS
ncbi:DUF6243 family protein [Streptomyces sp. TRM64462]|uniref:DUF6243 family protein n=1 Tax=Streptomyces sp. TRM64462 TaxID=2741726 RepID=UPI0015863F1D|nr:DUF6243 family protein [Streptomyces sp. TRM64462]